MLKRFLFVIFLLIPPAGLAGQPVLLILGDSLSAGYGLAPGTDWVALLEERLRDKGYPHRVVNASVSGDTTAGGLARLPRALERNEPELLLIALGGNDGLRGIPPQTTEQNLAAMIEAGQARGSRVLLATIRLPPNYGPAFGQRFAAIFEQLAAQYEVPLIPFIPEDFAERSGLVQPDGIHPNAEAQPVLLEQVWPVLEPELEGATVE